MRHKTILQLGAAAVALALLLRLMSGGAFGPFVRAVCGRELLSFLIYTQTGRRSGTVSDRIEPTNSTSPTETTQQSAPTQGAPDAVLSFSQSDLAFVQVNAHCDREPDLEALLAAPLELELAGETPTVLIIHTHGSESYKGDYTPVEPYRSLDNRLNMIAVGDEVARLLELRGIGVIHDRSIYDYPDYNGSYTAARRAIQDHLEEYPTIQLVLDLHRDAAEGDAGQLVTAATVGSQRAAQLMLVVGTDANGLDHPDWEKNLALALKLNVLLEQENPGITRPVSLRSQRFNMDLCPGSLLVEVGAAGNTLEEALIAANALADAVVKLAKGSR